MTRFFFPGEQSGLTKVHFNGGESGILQVWRRFPPPAPPQGPVWASRPLLPPEPSQWDQYPKQPARASPCRYSGLPSCSLGLPAECKQPGRVFIKHLLAHAPPSVLAHFPACTLSLRNIFMMFSRWREDLFFYPPTPSAPRGFK